MKFTDCGHIINLRKHAENSLILTLISKEHGKVTGYVGNCLHKKNLGIYQLGNKVKIDAYSRVDDNMLSFRVELISPDAVNFLNDYKKISALAAFSSLCNSCLPELENLEDFYFYAENFFNHIHEDNWIAYYSFYEFYLLEYLGVGLDLSECAVTKSTQNLAYVSPKSGKAVCREAGEPYKEKLFLYPHFIMNKNTRPNERELADLLAMTGFFLQKNFFADNGLKFPENRANLLENLDLNR